MRTYFGPAESTQGFSSSHKYFNFVKFCNRKQSNHELNAQVPLRFSLIIILRFHNEQP